MQILKVVLYSFDGRTRELDFQPGAVNIITGESDTGKTAVSTIVRYCLGRDDFRVPAGVIRKKVSWFGLLLQLADTQIFIARPNPGPGRSSNSQVYYDIGANLEVPSADSLHPIANTDALTRLLSGRIGIGENVFEPDEGETRPPISANIKHAFAFNFQHQNEIASQEHLFHRQSEQWFAQAVKDTFPYFLGAVDADRLRLRQELKREKSRLKRLRQQLSELTSLQADGLSRGRALLAEAAELGLSTPPEGEATLASTMELLRAVTAWAPGLPEGAPDRSALVELGERRSGLMERFNRLQFDLEKVRILRHEQSAFSGELAEQKARLRSLGIIKSKEQEAACPVCAAPVDDNLPSVADLQTSLLRLQLHLTAVSTEEPKLAQHAQGLEDEIRSVRAQLSEVRAAERAIIEASQRDPRASDLTDRRLMAKGRVSLYLESVRSGSDKSVLEAEVAEAIARVEELERELSNEDVKRTVTSMLNTMAVHLTAWAKRLKLAHSDHLVRIDADQMTIVADTADGGIPLQNMGSGGNWVGYHLVAYLGLHQWFIEKKRPVPRFLFLDQPTQAFYPPEQRDWNGDLEALRDEDSVAVRRMFALIFDVVRSLAPNFQVIVIDHADFADPDFESAVRDRWREGRKLVPSDWPDDSEVSPA